MPSLAVVSVFYLDQDSSFAPPCRIVSRIEARRLKQIAAGKFIDNGRNFRLNCTAPPLPIVLPPGPLQSATTITNSEVEANVGIAARSALVKRAQHKIRAYPHVFDDLAILARGSWMRPAVQIAVAS
jgi:hypothetical protein